MTQRDPDQLDLFKKPIFETRIESGPVDLNRFRARISRCIR